MERVLREAAFEGESHIVTGAAQGIGRSVAAALAAHGAQVTLVDLDEGRLGEVRAPARRTCSARWRRPWRRAAASTAW
jgi:NAD(P)-dependent dehydrogenase (short-subunit alcohol dehydrogenase family)